MSTSEASTILNECLAGSTQNLKTNSFSLLINVKLYGKHNGKVHKDYHCKSLSSILSFDGSFNTSFCGEHKVFLPYKYTTS